MKREDFAEITFSPCPGGKQEKVSLAFYAVKYDIASPRSTRARRVIEISK